MKVFSPGSRILIGTTNDQIRATVVGVNLGVGGHVDYVCQWVVNNQLQTRTVSPIMIARQLCSRSHMTITDASANELIEG